MQQETDRIKNEKGQGCCLEDMVKNLHVDAFVNLCRAQIAADVHILMYAPQSGVAIGVHA